MAVAAGTLTYKTELDTSGVQKAGSTVKSIIAGLGITKLISTAMNEIKNSTDDAIKRLDTLNNFPKVMSNLGIASEDADKSIKKMSDKLSGLPTTLDQGASAVQRFTSANGDVEKSTDIFLALNNAILAGGASTEIQATALEQMSQAYAKGKPDMMEWRSLMTAMPAQLKQVADAMGYASADELGESLRNGSVSMDEFMDTITKLNTEGLNGFQSFEEQAKNSTGGIATSITVAKTQIVKGVADIIKGLNDGLAQANLPSISEIISMVGKKAKEVLDMIASNLPSAINFIKNTYNTIKPILPIIEALAVGILAIVTAYTAYQKIVSIVTAVQTALNFVMAMNPIGLIVLAIVGLIAVLVTLWNKSETFRNIVLGIFNAIKTGFEALINGIKIAINFVVNIFTSIIDFVKNNWQSLLLFLVNPFAGAFKLLYDNCDGFREFINNFINTIINFFKKLATNIKNIVIAVVDTIKSLPGKMISIGFDIARGIGNGITSGITWLKNKIREFVGNVTKFIRKMFKIGSPSKLMSDEVGQWLPKGIAVGIEANTDSVDDAMEDMYKDMDRTIKMENSKLNFDVLSGDVYNKAFFTTPVSIDIKADVEMDNERVGRIITPSIAQTFKQGGYDV